MVFRSALAIVVLGACDQGSGIAKGAECRAAVATMVETLAPHHPATAAVVPQLIVQCDADHWSARVRSCMAQSTTRHALRECWHEHLTGVQLDHIKATAAPINTARAEALANMISFRDKMCACKTRSCVDGVNKEWNDTAKTSEPWLLGWPPGDDKSHTRMMEEMGLCEQKASNP